MYGLLDVELNLKIMKVQQLMRFTVAYTVLLIKSPNRYLRKLENITSAKENIETR